MTYVYSKSVTCPLCCAVPGRDCFDRRTRYGSKTVKRTHTERNAVAVKLYTALTTRRAE